MKPLLINDSEENIPEALLESLLQGITKELTNRKILNDGNRRNEVSVVFLKEVDAKHLNWNYRQRDYATDILSFETEDPESLGELVLCPAVLHKQSKEHDVSFEDELGYLVLHGVLHLLGFDHEKNEEKAKEMMKLQDEIFEVLRTPPPKAKKAKAPVKTETKKAPAKAAKAKAANKKTVKPAPAKAAKSAKPAATAKKAKKK